MIPGTKPKPPGQKVNRSPVVHEWREYPDEPFRGCDCEEPEECGRVHIPPPPRKSVSVRQWWAVVSTMPHCADWKAGDWQFARDTALVYARFVAGDMTRAQELRVRQTKMGMTEEGRRDLRIRYVPISKAEPGQDGLAAVTDLSEERRRRLLEED